MVPARNLLRRHYDSYGCCFSNSSPEKQAPLVLRSGHHMAEEPSRGGGAAGDDEDDEETEAGTSSKESDDWLQLGIGRSPSTPASGSSSARLTELELFSHRPPPATTSIPSSSLVPALSLSRMPPPSSVTTGAVVVPTQVVPISMFQPPPLPHVLSYRRDVPWGFWGAPHMMPLGMPAPPPPPPPPLQYSFRRFVGSGPSLALGEGSAVAAGADVRVLSPPRRPQAGVWFVLQAAQNQVKEPFLPQIPKSYLRIKDGRMTVRLLMKYLVNKLGLDDESEVEITCRGQPLLPFLTLQHVRDNIWCLRAAVELLPESQAADHVMILQYGRSST